MSSSDRRAFVISLGGGAAMAMLAGCGFRPLYRKGGPGDALVGSIALQEAADPADFAFRERLRRRFGDADDARYRLIWDIDLAETGVAVTSNANITRFQIIARARYRLLSIADETISAEGEVRTTGAYDATSAVFAARSARRDERERLAVELAELTATRVLAAGD